MECHATPPDVERQLWKLLRETSVQQRAHQNEPTGTRKEKSNFGGEIQGKPDNMQLWAMESSLLQKMHEDHCHGVELKDPTGTMSSKRTGDSYVDDKDTLASAPETNSIEEGVENIQKKCPILGHTDNAGGTSFCFPKMLLARPVLDGLGRILCH
eukprot:scaffold26588_cov82-Cyclotella_meneghiniana.AAC.3